MNERHFIFQSARASTLAMSFLVTHASANASLSATPSSSASASTSVKVEGTQDTPPTTTTKPSSPSTESTQGAPLETPAPTAEKDGAKPATPAAANALPEKPPTVPTADNIVEAHAQKDLPTQRVVLFGESFDAELCLDQGTRALGMGARDRFPAGTAMIFVHPRPIMLNYWMKDCFIDMDMIFVDGQGRITAFYEATRETLRTKSETVERYESRLYRYSSRRPAQFVIEVPPGSIKRLKPALGQQIQLDWASLAKRAK